METFTNGLYSFILNNSVLLGRDFNLNILEIMKKMMIIVSIIALLMGTGISFIFYKAAKKIESEKQEMKSKIGDKYILDGDTLTITDCSWIEDSYTLSNGVKINKELINPSQQE